MSTRSPMLFAASALLLLMAMLSAASAQTTSQEIVTCQPRAAPDLTAGRANQIPVLLYHDLAPEELGIHEENAMVVPAESFAEQMEWLAAEGYYTPTLSELTAFLDGRLHLPQRSVLITFDDGYESNYQFAHPVLCQLGFRAVLFKIGARSPNPRSFHPALRTHITWGQLHEMIHSEVWEIENHTYKGHDMIWGRAPLLIWDQETIVEDLAKVDQLWIGHGLPATRAIAYPFGAYDAHTLEAVRMTDLQLGFTIEPGFAAPGMDKLLLPRLAVYPQHSLEAFGHLVRVPAP